MIHMSIAPFSPSSTVLMANYAFLFLVLYIIPLIKRAIIAKLILSLVNIRHTLYETPNQPPRVITDTNKLIKFPITRYYP